MSRVDLSQVSDKDLQKEVKRRAAPAKHYKKLTEEQRARLGTKLAPGEQEVVDALFAAVPPIKGEVRSVCRCNHCGWLYCHRYIPYGLGRGAGTKRCLCQLTQHPNFTTVIKKKP